MPRTLKVSACPENYITAIRLRHWGVTAEHRPIWEKLEEGDRIIFHSTQDSTFYAHPPSTILGYGEIGRSKHRKDEFWWIQEFWANENKWPYVFELSQVYLFKNFIDEIDLTRPLLEKSYDEVNHEVSLLLESGIHLRDFEDRAKLNNPYAKGFMVHGGIGTLDEVYDNMIRRLTRNRRLVPIFPEEHLY